MRVVGETITVQDYYILLRMQFFCIAVATSVHVQVSIPLLHTVQPLSGGAIAGISIVSAILIIGIIVLVFCSIRRGYNFGVEMGTRKRKNACICT